MTSQLIYYYNYKNEIKPTFLKVFQMMSGLVSPKSIGLTNEKEIYKLIKLSKNLFLICEFVVKFAVSLFALTVTFLPYIINYSAMDTIIFGIPNSFIFTLCYYIYNINLWQVLYFYIICKFIKTKIKEFNQNILSLIKKRRFLNRNVMIEMIRSLDSLYLEINEYNTKFWSKYLLSIWLIMGSFINVLLFVLLLSQINILYRFMTIFGLFLFVSTFLMIINSQLFSEKIIQTI